MRSTYPAFETPGHFPARLRDWISPASPTLTTPAAPAPPAVPEAQPRCRPWETRELTGVGRGPNITAGQGRTLS
jgi:hypothetical protein